LKTGWYTTRDAAIAAWNQRAGEADYRRLRELEQAVRAMREFAPDTLVWQHNYDAIGRLLEGEE
jgi:hypothetical protein